MNPYEVLEIERNATPDAIRQAYRKKAQEHHPDKNPNDPKATDKFQQVQIAYEVLSDPARRKNFDDTGSIENNGESLYSLALQSIAGLAMQWAEQEVEHQGEDPVAAIRNRIMELTAQHQQSKVKCEKRIAKLERKMKRFHIKRGSEVKTNIFTSTFEHAIRTTRQELAVIERMIQCGKIAQEIMADYEYDSDSDLPPSLSKVLGYYR